MIYKMTLTDSSDTMTFNLLETPIVDKDIEGAVDNVTLDGNQYTDYLYLKKQYIQKWAIMCPDEYDELRGFYTRQFEEGEIPSYRVYYGANVTKDYIYNGDYFQFNAKGIETGMSLSQLSGNATQSGTPTPDAPVPISTVTGEQVVKITGKNLIDLEPYYTGNNWYNIAVGSQFTTGSDNRISLSVDSNGIGTASVGGNWLGLVFVSVPLAEGSSYRLNIASASSTSTLGLSVYTLDSNHKTVRILGNSTANPSGDSIYKMTATLQSGERYIAIAIGTRTGDGSTATITFGTVQLELGSTATAYEPYQGQEYEVNLGKNLFDYTDVDGNPSGSANLGYTTTDDKLTLTALTTTGAQYLRYIFDGFDKTKTYTFSCDATKVVKGTDGSPILRIICYGSDTPENAGTWTQLAAPSMTTPTQGTTYKLSATLTGYKAYRFFFYNNSNTPVTIGEQSVYSNIQLELGQATTYAPYFTPIELAKIGTYQDRIYKDDGTWYVEKQVGKVVLDGTESYTQRSTSTAGLYRYDLIVSALAPGVAHAISDHFVISNESNFSNITTVCFATHPNETKIVFFSNETTDTAFKTWLGTHNTTVYYALATPTTTEITDETLLSQLNFIASLYEGVNNISIVGTGAQGEMEVLIRDVLDVETDVVPETPVRLTLTDGGVINACGCRRDVQLTMRETTE